MADISITSFHSSKIVTTGEGGMIFTDDDDLATHCRDIINQGYGPKGYDEHNHVAKGFNFGMTGMQAALGCVQIRKLPKLLEERARKARIYDALLADHVELHRIPSHMKSSYYSYLIMLPTRQKRNTLKDRLMDKGVESKLWKPVHLHPPYKGCGRFPNAEQIYDRHLRLPIHNSMTEEETIYVAEMVIEGLG